VSQECECCPQIGGSKLGLRVPRKSRRRAFLPFYLRRTKLGQVSELEKQVVATAPARGTQPFTESSSDRQPFTALPLSQRTTRGLTDGGFKTMTEIQVSRRQKPPTARRADSPVEAPQQVGYLLKEGGVTDCCYLFKQACDRYASILGVFLVLKIAEKPPLDLSVSLVTFCTPSPFPFWIHVLCCCPTCQFGSRREFFMFFCVVLRSSAVHAFFYFRRKGSHLAFPFPPVLLATKFQVSVPTRHNRVSSN